MIRLLLLSFLFTSLFLFAETKRTTSGLVEGISLDGVEAYLGIPFAESTAGSNRWKAPITVKPWQGVREAKVYAPECPQSRSENASEDCLSLNVWVPKTEKKNLPVMVWIHGGKYISGNSNNEILGLNVTDGSILAAKHEVVVVSVNYRLGALGFFSHPLMHSQSAVIEANFGLLDMIESLKWVQRNIAAFNGSPSRVTIFGESAGGNAVVSLLASPMAKGLFRAAIAQSPWITTLSDVEEPSYISLEKAKEMALELSEKANCTTMDCLKALPFDKLLELQSSLSHETAAIEQTKTLPSSVLNLFQKGAHNRVPTILGANSKELLFETKTDESFQCPLENVADALSRHAPTYSYEFGVKILRVVPALHGVEIPFVFGTLLEIYRGTRRERRVVEEMGQYWTDFAKDPSVRPYRWARYRPFMRSFLQFGETRTQMRWGSRCQSRDK